MERYLTFVKKIFQHLTVSHTVPAKSQKVTAVLKFIIICTVYPNDSNNILYLQLQRIIKKM
jgi:hypothetical protein